MIYESTGGIKDRKRMVLSRFLGVDAANPIYAIDKTRASAMRNFININGSNHKRPGYRQFGRFKDSSGKDLPINGYFKFTIARQNYNIVYAGTRFFAYDEASESYFDLISAMREISGYTSLKSSVDESLLKSQKVELFVQDDRAYFIGCGDFLVFGIYDGIPQLRRVYNDEMTYIPRTTTNIAPNEIETDANNNVISYADRQTDRDVNVFSSMRYNELIGSAQADPDAANDGANPTYRTYNLDAEGIEPTDFSVEFYDYDESEGTSTDHVLVMGDPTTDWLGSSVSETRTPTVGDNLKGKTLSFDTTIDAYLETIAEISSSERTIIDAGVFKLVATREDEAMWNSVKVFAIYDGAKALVCEISRTNVFNSYHVDWTNGMSSYTISNSVDCIVTSVSLSLASSLGVTASLPAVVREIVEKVSDDPTDDVLWGYIDLKNGVMAIIRPMRPIAGEANIKVRFSKTDSDKYRTVANCTFGAYFGVHGNVNTLFLSGNAEAKHFDFWSQPEDFTYFPSKNYCQVGTQNTAVMGYIRLGDDSLAIIKEPSYNEPTLYIRTGKSASVEDNVVTEGYYLTSGKFLTEGCVSGGTCRMLAGDALFLSPKGIFGIAINSDSIAIEQRVAKERSRYINELLKRHADLRTATSASAIVYQNRYYLALDGIVYIADARYKFTEREDMDDTFNYEWWVWDNCPIRGWYEIDGELCFGTNDGRLCVFDKEYTDRTYETITSYTPDLTNNRITPNREIPTGRLVYFKGDVYRLVFAADDLAIENGRLVVSEEKIGNIAIGQTFYADTITGTGLSLNTKYIVDSIDYGDCAFVLASEDGTVVTPSATGFRLLANINGEIMKVAADVDDNEDPYVVLQNYYTEQEYTLALYDDTAISAEFREHFPKNVVAEWYTPVMDMGANDQIKQLLSLTIATEQITKGKLKFGWETRGADSLVDLDSKGFDAFDFGNLDFDRFSFDTGFSSSFSRKVKASFNYIIFRFVSDNEYDCCVHSFTIGYKFNRRNKGVF